MHGSQPKLSSVVGSSVSWDLILGFLSSRFWFATTISMVAWESSQNLGTPPLVSPQNDVWKWLQKLLTGRTSCVTSQISVVLLIAIFPWLTTNQKYYPELGIGTSTVWNFCSHFSDVISQGNQWWCWKMSAVFSGYLTVVQFSWCKVAVQLGETQAAALFPRPHLYGDKLSWVEGTFSYKMWWTVYVRNKKLASLEEWPAQPGRRVTALLHSNDFVHS